MDSTNKNCYKICSWDIGIVNLAYCILEIDLTSDDKTPKIEKWEVINLFEKEINVCSCKYKNGNPCKSKAKYYGKTSKSEINGETEYYCGMHKSQFVQLSDDFWKNKCVIVPRSPDKNECEYMMPKKQQLCGKNSRFSFDNKHYCTSHKNKIINDCIKEHSLRIIKTKKVKRTPQEICTQIFAKLDSIGELLSVDEVIIENQPALTNPIMKSVASFIMCYFVSKITYVDTNIKYVKFVSASNKLKIDEKRTNEVLENYSNSKDKYEKTKNLGIIYTYELLKEIEGEAKWLDYVKMHSKKDDLCDCYLQGVYYLNKKFC